jgi:hypothetical protein
MQAKISSEYFPIQTGAKRKSQRCVVPPRSTLNTLVCRPFIIADVMLYNIEIAQAFSAENTIKQEFYKSMLNSFEQAIVYMIGNGILNEFKIRIDAIHQETIVQNWKTSKTSTQSSRDLSTSIFS